MTKMFCTTMMSVTLQDFAKWFSEVLVDISKRPVLSSLLLSLLLLFLVSLYKYYNITRPTRKEFWHLIVEIPIDISLIFSTVFISFNVHGVSWAFVFTIFMPTLIFTYIQCMLRRSSIEQFQINKKCYLWGLFDWVLCCVNLFIVYSFYLASKQF